MRRSGRLSDAATATSGESGEGGEPNAAIEPSKPEPGPPDAEPILAPGLYLVATPIGNLADIGLRALAVLRGADRIYCEDTRVTAKLLARYRIAARLEPYHDHNAEAVRPAVLAALRRGERVALVSDAGTPLISDPGYKLVHAAIADDLPVTAIPGASAALSALLVSGLPPDCFLFAGFLPRQASARRRTLTGWARLDATLIFSTKRRLGLPRRLPTWRRFWDRARQRWRELTKLHEQVHRGQLDDLALHFRQAGPPRGETVIVVAPPPRPAALPRGRRDRGSGAPRGFRRGRGDHDPQVPPPAPIPRRGAGGG